MMVPLPNGTMEKIDHLLITESQKTLRVLSSPIGNAAGTLLAMQKKAQSWVDKAKEGHLRQQDSWFLLDCQFWPGVSYGICCNLVEHWKLEECLAKQYYELLTLGCVI